MIPDIYKNFNEVENLAREIKRLKQTAKKQTQINSKMFFEDLVLVYGGRFIKFGKLIPNPKKRPKDAKTWNDFVLKEMEGLKFTNINANFCMNEEVIKITETDSGRLGAVNS